MDGADKEYRKWLTVNSTALCDSTANLNAFLRCLTTKLLVDSGTGEKVKRENGDPAKFFKLYEHLKAFGYTRIGDIIECLRDSNNDHVAKKFSDFKAKNDEDHGLASGPVPVVLDFYNDNTPPLVMKVQHATGICGDEGKRYKMTSKPRGCAQIINNRQFADPTHRYHYRAGSEHDFRILQHLFRDLQYDVTAKENVSSTELEDFLNQFKSECQIKNVNSCFVCIMSHGSSETLVMADGFILNYLTDFVWQFDARRFPSFEDKPKILVIATCPAFSCGLGKTAVNATPSTSPQLTNMLVCSPTVPGTTSWRNVSKGTHYINCLAQVIMNEARRTEAKILFGDMVQENMRKVKSKKPLAVQIPECKSYGFNKQFYFNPGV